MKRTIVVITVALALIASMAVAQQRRGPATPPPALGTPQTFTGTVVSFAASAGTMHPALVVSDGTIQKSFVLGPYWFLAESKFAAAAGDKVVVVSLACSECISGDAVVSASNQTNGTKVVLRDTNGAPLWQNGKGNGNAGFGPGNGQHNGGGMGMGMGMGGNCGGILPDMTRKASFEGTIVSFTGGPGVGEPELTVATVAGNKAFVPSPYRVILDAGYSFTTGAKLAITAAPVIHDGEEEWVIITMKDVASGLELNFRDATGYPLAGHGGFHGRP